MGQSSSRQTVSTRASTHTIRPTTSKYPRQYTLSGETVEDTHGASKPTQRTTSHRSNGRSIRSSARHLRTASGNAAQATIQREQSSKSTRKSPTQEQRSTPVRQYSYETEPDHLHHSGRPPFLYSKSKSPVAESKSHHRRSQPKKECVICTNSRSIAHFPAHPPTLQCAHDADVCRRCLRTWISTTFATKIWDEIDCPTCSERLHYEDVREFAPSDIFRKYDKISAKAALEAIPNFRWCILKGCKSGQVHEDATNKFRCVGCKKSHCIEHDVTWHKGETCKEYDYRMNKKIKKEEEKASKKLIQETAKTCPGCKRPIEKSYGCDHMTCTKCRHEFCWQCLALYEKKKGQKSVVHRGDCVYSDDNVRRAGAVIWDEGF